MADGSRRRYPALIGALAAVLCVVLAGFAWYSLARPAPKAATPVAETPPSTEPAKREFPTATTTGVLADVSLQQSGSITVDEPGTVIEGLRVQGRITVEASGVTIRNTLVETGGSAYGIRIVSPARGVLIENVEVDNQDAGGIGIFFNGGSGVVRSANIHSGSDGIRIQSSDVTIEKSYIHDLKREPGGHHDSIQIRSGDDVAIRGNSLGPYVAMTADPMNSAIQVGSLLEGPLSALTVEDNLMDGGNFTINGGDGVASGSITGNVFGPHARYGVRTSMSSAVLWRDNVMLETGQPAG